MEKMTLVVAMNGVDIVGEKFTEEQAEIMIDEMDKGLTGNLALSEKYGFKETYTKETVDDGVWKYTFTVSEKNGKSHVFYIYLSGTAVVPKFNHAFKAEMYNPIIDKELVVVFCDTIEDLHFYKALTEMAMNDQRELIPEGFEMKYSA
jgi:hypothetical protein